MPRKTPEQQVEHYQQLLDAAKARKREEERRAETRRKIILGAGLSALARKEPGKAREAVKMLFPHLAENDRDTLRPFFELLVEAASRGA